METEAAKESSGTWWIPNHREQKIQGTLVFDPQNGLQLQSSNSFEDLTQDAPIPRIFGQTDQGQEVTLQQCSQTKGEVRVEGETRTKSAEYRCEKALIGGHFSDESVQFDRVLVEMPWLTEWVGVSGIEISGALVSDSKTENDAKDDFVLKYNSPELPPISVDGLSLQFRANTSFEIDWGGKAVINEDMILHIDSVDGSRTLASFLDSIDTLFAFLSLALRKQVSPARIIGITNPGTENESRVEALSTAVKVSDDEDSLDPDQIVFRYQDLEPETEHIIRSWFEKYDELEPVLDLYFSAVYESKSYYRDRIITLLSALEAFHQARYADQYITTEDIETYFEEHSDKEVIEFTEESVDELQSKFKTAGYPSLRYRITELIEETEPVSQVLHDDYQIYVNKLTTVRNELVHGSDVDLSDSEAATIQALPELIMDGLLLTEVGLSPDTIKDYLHRAYPDLTHRP